MPVRNRRRQRPPLTPESLNELALAYVGRFATTRSKLASYLQRKLRERGWDGASEPPVEALVSRFVASGLVDDAAYALSKSRSLAERGYGAGRLRHSLRAAGVEEADSGGARELADEQAVEAALRFARRRRIGPFAQAVPDPKGREKALAAMVRAGHSFDLARAVIDCLPGEEPDPHVLRYSGR
jgi:regulatory protein